MGKKKESEPIVSDRGYVTILGWMVTELGLSGSELVIYAVIYGFSQTENQWFTGTHQYLADWSNITIRNVIRNLNSLLEKGFIERGEREYKGQICPRYRVTISDKKGVTKCHTPHDKMSHPPVTKCHTPHDKMSPDIKDNNIELNNNIYNPPYSPPLGENAPHGDVDEIPKKRNVFIPPSVEEVRAYCVERNNGVDAERFVDYYTSNGWMVGRTKMKDWKAAVRTWERSDAVGGSRDRGGGTYSGSVGKSNGFEMSSFDTDEFFEAALAWSYDRHPKVDVDTGIRKEEN